MNLQKIVRLTQHQYDILKAGGSVGDYTGIDPSYLYLISDANNFLPLTGGTISGRLVVDNSDGTPLILHYNAGNGDYAIAFVPDNDGTSWLIGCEDYGLDETYRVMLPMGNGILALQNDLPQVKRYI